MTSPQANLNPPETMYLFRDEDRQIFILNGEEAKKLKRLPIREQTWLQEFCSILSFMLYFGPLAFCGPLICVSVFFAIYFQSYVAWAFLILLSTATVFPREIHTWPWFVNELPFWTLWRRYFNLTFIKTCDVPTGRYIFAEWPHGIFMMGQWLSQGTHDMVFPGSPHTKGAAADSALRLPIMRQLYGWYGCVSASLDSLKKEQSRGYNIGLVPGGIAEMFLSSLEREVLFFEKRTGYINLAIDLDMKILPVYHLGNTQIFKRASTGDGFLTDLSRKFRVAIFWAWGRFGLPIPYQTPIICAVGKPIECDKSNNREDEIKRVQGLIKAQLIQLFEDYKHLIETFENKQLEFE